MLILDLITMDIVSNLNPKQLEAVTYEGTKLLVLAGAGSGKTKVLTHRAAWFIEEKNIPANQILLLTFTNKTAKEMKIRMEKMSAVWAGTFHRSEEHTSELQSHSDLVCRLLLEKKQTQHI